MILVSYGLFPADRKADFSGPGARLLIGCPGSGDRHVRDVPTRVLHWEMTEPRVPLNYLILVRRMAAFWYPPTCIPGVLAGFLDRDDQRSYLEP